MPLMESGVKVVWFLVLLSKNQEELSEVIKVEMDLFFLCCEDLFYYYSTTVPTAVGCSPARDECLSMPGCVRSARSARSSRTCVMSRPARSRSRGRSP